MRLLDRIRTRLRSERGFTLTELLMAVSIGMIVIFAAVNLIDSSLRASADVLDRMEGLQKGRITMEQLTQRFRAQTCPNGNTPAIVAGTTNSISFFSELGGEAFAPEGRRITLAANGTLTEEVWNTLAATPANTFNGPPSSTRVITTELAPRPGQPFLRYFAFEGNDPALPALALTAPLSAADRARVVKIEVGFDSRPSRKATTQNRLDTTFVNFVFVRTADPTDPDRSPKCD